jgi:hypothetical protein
MCKLIGSHNGYCDKCEIPCSIVIPFALKLIYVELSQQLSCPPSIHFTSNTHNTIFGCNMFSLCYDTATYLIQHMET